MFSPKRSWTSTGINVAGHHLPASTAWYTSRELNTALTLYVPSVSKSPVSSSMADLAQSCISEAQKYQGALYRPEKEKKKNNNNNQNNTSKALVPQRAYVEDADDEYNDHSGDVVLVELPEAPSPPSAAPHFEESNGAPANVNVFDFLVDAETPNPSTLQLAENEGRMLQDSPVIVENTVRFDDDSDRDYDYEGGMLIQYGAGPVLNGAYQTPAPKAERERKSRKSEGKDEKKDKKRKRLHVDTAAEPRDADEAMTDAPPVLHSGLTGGLGRLLSRPSVFPPSPDYSGGDAGDASPGSPLKRSKHSKREKEGRVDKMSNTLMALISTRKSKDTDDERPRKHRSSRNARTGTAKVSKTKMIEYTPLNGAVTHGNDSQMVLYQDRAELFMSFVDKGPNSERGCSMNKALKRYHRERTSLGMGRGKGEEEKELWRSLRMKRNDRGEIVLFLP